MMTSAQVVETSVNVTKDSPSRDYSHQDDQTRQTRTSTPFAVWEYMVKKIWEAKLTVFCDFEEGRNVELKFDKWNHKTMGKTL